MNIYQSTEDYLEAILVLSKSNSKVRSIDIANHLEFSKPSVSIALKKFVQKKYVEVDDAGNIFLTESGMEIASKVYERHTVITNLLMLLGVSEENAKLDACKIEHEISQESFDKMKEFVQSK